MNHRLEPAVKKPSKPKRAASIPSWPSYQGQSQFVGTSPSGRVTVYVDPSLGQPALQNAQDLVNDADRVASANDGIFGTTGGAVSVIIFALGGMTDGTGGADHLGCDYVTGNAIEVCASFGNSARVSALFEAELSECSMGGRLCGLSTGEALSRWCAAAVGNNALADFATAPQWFQDGMPDFVDQTDNTDQNADSTGCGMAFISWLMSQGQALSSIAPAMVNLGDGGTLAQLYANLTGDDAGNAWTNFQNAINGLANGVSSDDPFSALPQFIRMSQQARLRLKSQGDVPSSDVRQFLQAFEHAYNCLVIFQDATSSREAAMNWVPNAIFDLGTSESMVLPSDQLVVSAVSLSSPGFWEFLGAINPLEIIRKYLQDRHERKKDAAYRNDQERRAKEVEILMRETELIGKRIELAKQAGAPIHIVNSLYNDLVARPLAVLGALQDGGGMIIEAVETNVAAAAVPALATRKDRSSVVSPRTART